MQDLKQKLFAERKVFLRQHCELSFILLLRQHSRNESFVLGELEVFFCLPNPRVMAGELNQAFASSD